MPRPKKNITAKERFWNGFVKKEKCWEWSGCLTDGYGRLRVNGEYLLAHRFSYELHIGKIPYGICVLHRCDNPKCVNPDHLFLGTRGDNNRDRELKGRGGAGIKQPAAKLTNEKAERIRAIYAAGGTTMGELHRQFGVSYTIIHGVIHGLRWKQA